MGLLTVLDHEWLQLETYSQEDVTVTSVATVGLTYLSAPGRHRVVYTVKEREAPSIWLCR